MKTTILILSLFAISFLHAAGPPEVRLMPKGSALTFPPPLPAAPVNAQLRAFAAVLHAPCPKCHAHTQRIEEFKAKHGSDSTHYDYKLKCTSCANLWPKSEVVR